MTLGILDFVLDTDGVHDTARRIMAALPSGSCLALTHPTTDADLGGEGDVSRAQWRARPGADAVAVKPWRDRSGRSGPVGVVTSVEGLLARPCGAT